MIKKTAIVGMGALGLLYANQIAEGQGKDAVAFVMDSDRVNKYKDTVFTINGKEVKFNLQDATTATPADLVIVAVKYNGLESAIETIKNCVDEHTIIMSVMNGITSEEIIADAYGMDHMIYTVAQGMDAMKFGDELRYTKMGELRIGIIKDSQKDNLDKVIELFEAVKMPYTNDPDILYRMWAKFMLNVGVNQTCLAYTTTYSGCLTEGSEANEVFIGAMREVVALANAEGIALSEANVKEYCDIIATLDPDGVPSMRQDGIAKRRSEVEMFAGTVIRMAKKHNLPTPVNQLLYDKVREIEATYIC